MLVEQKLSVKAIPTRVNSEILNTKQTEVVGFGKVQEVLV